MAKHNAENERIKRDYFQYLKEAKGRDEKSLDVVAKAIHRFELSTRYRDFKRFHKEQAIAFKRRLAEQLNEQTGKPLSKATIGTTMRTLHNFFEWLAGQPGYKSKLSYSDADYFSVSEKDLRINSATPAQPVPSMEQLHHVIDKMPAGTDIEKRNRAIMALILLTGVRDGALISLRLKHINIAEQRLDQDAREVNTKFAKTFQTWFFPVGGSALEIVSEWVHYLRIDLLFGDGDPLFPKTKVGVGDNGFEAKGLDRQC
ncbi:site-specific integrase [Parasphingorhabdus sp.]|jgi:site-specific recombinase XerD|uniref:site-specific integrase n=1 Tax=Parasphingorhabdus sp. TaxID=2709688 RepID=UPI003D2BE0F8